MTIEKVQIAQESNQNDEQLPVTTAQPQFVPLAVAVPVPISEPSTGAVYRKNCEIPDAAKRSAVETKFLFLRTGSVVGKGRNYVPEKITLSGLLGGTTLDFSNSVFVFPKTTITTSGLLRSIHIYVPPGVQVVMSGVSLLGGFRNRNVAQWSEDSPVIEIKGLHVLGSVTAEVNTAAPPIFITRPTLKNN